MMRLRREQLVTAVVGWLPSAVVTARVVGVSANGYWLRVVAATTSRHDNDWFVESSKEGTTWVRGGARSDAARAFAVARTLAAS